MTSEDLARELGMEDRPAWLERLPSEVCLEIVALRERRRVALHEAIDGCMASVPRLLRGAIKKVLFP
jgi:hypothetical protein